MRYHQWRVRFFRLDTYCTTFLDLFQYKGLNKYTEVLRVKTHADEKLHQRVIVRNTSPIYHVFTLVCARNGFLHPLTKCNSFLRAFLHVILQYICLNLYTEKGLKMWYNTGPGEKT